MNKPEDRRRHKRYNVDSIHGNLLYSSGINIVDISLKGAAIETSQRLEIGKDYSLKIRYRDTTLNLRGIIIWSLLSRTERQKTGHTVTVYKAGMKFTNTLTENSRNLLNFINENKTETIKKGSLAARFRVRDVGAAEIDYLHNYDIKKLSLSGMLIESDAVFDVDSRTEMDIFIEDRKISFTGRVVNCVELILGDRTLYNIGIEFNDMSPEDRDYLKNYISSLKER